MPGRQVQAARRLFGAATTIVLLLVVAGCDTGVSSLSANERNSISSLSLQLTGRHAARANAPGADTAFAIAGSGPAVQPVPISSGNPIASAIGAGIGLAIVGIVQAAATEPPEIMAAARKNLRDAAASVDVEQRLQASLTAPRTSNTVPPLATDVTMSGTPKPHVLKVDYAVGVRAIGIANNRAMPIISVIGRLTSPDGKTIIRQNNWVFCGVDVSMRYVATSGGEFVAREFERGATALGEAVLYDLFVNPNVRLGWADGGQLKGCMDFDDLPSGVGKRPTRPREPPLESPPADKPAT